MKRFVSAFLAILMLATAFPVVASATTAEAVQSRYYYDVYATDSYYDAVNYLHEHGVMEGTIAATDTQKGKFAPASPLTRGQVVTILWRMLNRPNPNGTATRFSDCESGTYYYNAVLWASSSNVKLVSGYEDNTFRPDRAVTQQEMLTFLYRFACHCAYASNATAAQNAFIHAFDSSPLTNKESFKKYSKAAVGWAYQNDFITSNEITGTSSCNRGNTAEYIYQFYKKYQKKYGLAVVNTVNMEYVGKCGTAMQTLFKHFGASGALSQKNITQAEFSSAMQSAFSNAKGLDICYLYCASHGGVSGLALFAGTPSTLTPQYLRTQIDKYNGTFVVFVSGCHSGTFVSKDFDGNIVTTVDVSATVAQSQANNESTDTGTSEFFDADNFIADLVKEEYAPESSDLRNGQRIKVLCSSRKDELSYSTDKFATYYWCLGSGYDYRNQSYVPMKADQNTDGRVSLHELYKYSYNEVQNSLPAQHIVCYPSADDFVIFESGY